MPTEAYALEHTMLLSKAAGISWISFAACWTMAGPAYPLKLAPGQHYVVDQNNYPFFIQGDSAWLLSKYLTAADQNFYLSNRWVQGFNSYYYGHAPALQRWGNRGNSNSRRVWAGAVHEHD